MRARQCALGLAAIWVALAVSAHAQEKDLAEQFKKALTPQSIQQSQPAVQKRMRAVGGQTSEPMQEVEGVTKPSLTMHLEFKFNSDELTPQTVKYLDALGTALQDQALRAYVYKVEGHTDNVGNDAYNLELSRKRALSVVDYMVKTFGLEREQFDVQGFGKKSPIAPNETEDGRRQNRRVVIVNTLQSFTVRAAERPVIDVKVKYMRAKEEKELREGDTLTQRDNYAIEFTPKTSARVYIFQVDTMNHIDTLFPNPEYSQSGNAVEPGRLYRVPNLGKWLYLDANKGKEHIVVIAQKTDISDPIRVCKIVLGTPDQTMMASSGPKRAAGDEGGRTRSIGGLREESRTVKGIREDKPIAQPQVSTPAPPPQPVAQPQVVTSELSQTPPSSPVKEEVPVEPIDMNKVFRWKLTFLHQ